MIAEKLKLFKRQIYLQIMALMGVVWMFIFCYVPMYGIIIAFKKYTVGKNKTMSEAPWVGLDNFKEFFADERLKDVIINTLGISIFKLLICFPLPILFAILLNELKNEKFKKFTQTISYLPHFFSWVVLGGILMNWLADVGFINELLVKIGLLKEPIYFLGEPQYFWGVGVVSELWKELGWSAIIYLAAITGIDPSLYEAAVVDGANRFQKITNITIPAISGTIALFFTLAVANMLSTNFDQIFVLRNSLNESKSMVIDIYVYVTGLRANRPSYATAISLVKSVIALILLISANKITSKMNKN